MQGFPSGGEQDLSRLQYTMQTIEQACSAIQMHMNSEAAEATILGLRQSPQPYQSCKFILENSKLANARFQAAGAIRDAALREWGILSDGNKKSLIAFCLCFVMEHASSTDAYVQTKVAAVAAQLLKRGWLDFSAAEKEAFFSGVKHAVLGIHGVDAQFVAINFLESLVSEFSPSTSTAMGLPAEFHEQCRSSLELEYLKMFYCWAQDAALKVTNEIAECNPTAAEDKVCSAALRLMYQILNWDFKDVTTSANASNNRIRHDTAMLKKYEYTLVQPGTSWHHVLISSGHVAWVLNVYQTLRQKFSCDVLWFDSPLAVSARQLIVQLCSLSGTIFPSDDGQMQEQHLLQLLASIIHWVEPPEAVVAAIKSGQSDSEMIDGCHALLSMATLMSTMMFDNLLKSLRPFGILRFLSTFTCEVIKTLAVDNDEEATWSFEALDILLETWNVLLGRTDFDRHILSTEGIDAAAVLFNTIVDSELSAVAVSAFDDNDDSEHFHASVSTRDERLSSYALIARAAADFSVPLLVRLFSERLNMLYQAKGTTDPTSTLEELHWLLLITGHVLTDSGQGETVMVPEALKLRFVNVVEAAQHPVVVLSWSVINFAERSLDPEMRAALFSPRLMEALIWFLARWADTYLMPLKDNKSESCPPGHEEEQIHALRGSERVLLHFAGEHNQGKPLLDIIVRISMVTLTSYPGENELQALTCHQLLPALVRRRNVCVHLISLDSWQILVNLFANERTLYSLTTRLQRSLAETFVRSASAMTDTEASNQYMRNLMGPVTAYLVDISTKHDIKAVAQRPDVILSVSCLLERLRGAARATEPRTQKAIFDMAVSVMNPILTLIMVYKDQSAVVYMILKFVVDLVNGQIAFLDPKDTSILVSFSMQLLQIYSSHNIGKISLTLSSNLLNEEKTERYKDLRALFQLLTNLCSKDLVDFSSISDVEESTDIAHVIYLGLHIVAPLVSLDLLKYPKLCYDYFALLTRILEVYPEKVAHLNMEGFRHIIGTLDFGICQQDIEVVDLCLRAVDALASYHYKEKGAGKEGLGAHAMGFQHPDGKLQEGILSHFLRLLLQLLLFEDFSMELVSSAADALLPLILCEQDLYQRLGHELMEREDNPALKLRLANALQSLTSSNQLSSSLDRLNHQKFRKNLRNFLIDVSGFLRTK